MNIELNLGVALFLCGIIVGAVVGIFGYRIGYTMGNGDRRRMERRLERLERHLSCGAGILGCKGGPQCDSDHK